MLKKDELTNPNSCLNRAAPDEPIFTLRANDPVAPRIVREWAFQYQHYKRLEKGDDQLNDKELRKYREAMELAGEMERWQSKQLAAL